MLAREASLFSSCCSPSPHSSLALLSIIIVLSTLFSSHSSFPVIFPHFRSSPSPLCCACSRINTRASLACKLSVPTSCWSALSSYSYLSVGDTAQSRWLRLFCSENAAARNGSLDGCRSETPPLDWGPCCLFSPSSCSLLAVLWCLDSLLVLITSQSEGLGARHAPVHYGSPCVPTPALPVVCLAGKGCKVRGHQP